MWKLATGRVHQEMPTRSGLDGPQRQGRGYLIGVYHVCVCLSVVSTFSSSSSSPSGFLFIDGFSGSG